MGPRRIVSVGARAALGLSALQVAMSVRAGLFEPRAVRFRDARGQSVGMCRVGGIGGECHGYERLVGLAAPALREAVGGRDLQGFSAVIALPAPARADDDPRFDARFAADVTARAGVAIDPRRVAIVRRGHAGGVEALRFAADELAAGRRGVVVGGVDSYYHPEVLRWLDEGFRLHAIGVEDGFVPGEGAAFAVIVGEASADDLAELIDARLGEEPSMLDEGLPPIAQGITALVRDVGGTGAPWVMHDANGEHRRQREWTMVSLRHELTGGEVVRLPDELGDLGAATAPMMVAIAATSWRHGAAPADRALLLVASDGADRGAALIARAS